MTIAHRTVIGEDGRPEAAIIPWKVFLQLQDLVADDEPTAEEREACLEAERDRREGKRDAFVRLDELEAELGI